MYTQKETIHRIKKNPQGKRVQGVSRHFTALDYTEKKVTECLYISKRLSTVLEKEILEFITKRFFFFHFKYI